MIKEPRISVIIPVWNGEKDIPHLLLALDRQVASRDEYEIIIIDNGSTDKTVEVVEDFSFVQLAVEVRPGSYAARNRAVALAKGTFLLFTDADCVPDPHWIAAALNRAELHGSDCLIGGRIELFRAEGSGPFSSRYDALAAGFNQEWNLANNHCVTANWLCSKEALIQIGGFNPELLSGGDGECAGRFASAGKKFIYAPEMLVRHPTRANALQLIRKKRRVVGGRWQKSKPKHNFMEFSKIIGKEYFDQMRWMKNSDIDTLYKPGVIALVALLWLITQFEIIRLALGLKPYRA